MTSKSSFQAVMSLNLFQLAQGREPMVLPACLWFMITQCVRLNLSLLTQQNKENLQLSPDPYSPLVVGGVWGRD